MKCSKCIAMKILMGSKATSVYGVSYISVILKLIFIRTK